MGIHSSEETGCYICVTFQEVTLDQLPSKGRFTCFCGMGIKQLNVRGFSVESMVPVGLIWPFLSVEWPCSNIEASSFSLDSHLPSLLLFLFLKPRSSVSTSIKSYFLMLRSWGRHSSLTNQHKEETACQGLLWHKGFRNTAVIPLSACCEVSESPTVEFKSLSALTANVTRRCSETNANHAKTTPVCCLHWTLRTQSLSYSCQAVATSLISK